MPAADVVGGAPVEAVWVAAGTRIHVRGQDWVVEKLRSGRLALRNLDDATLWHVAPGELIRLQDYATSGAAIIPLEQDEPPLEFAGTPFGFYEDLGEKTWQHAFETERRLNEIYTGSPRGDPSLEDPGWAPRYEYDPAVYPLNKRKEHANTAYGRGWNPRNIERKRRAQRAAGIAGLVNRTTIRRVSLGDSFEPAIRELLLEVFDDLNQKHADEDQKKTGGATNKKKAKTRSKSTRDKSYIYVHLKEKVKARNAELIKAGETALTLCSYRQFCRKFGSEGRSRGFHLSARTRTSIANEPEGTWRTLQAVRPGQYVLIDISPFDVLARDDRTGVVLRVRLVLALDLCTREIVAVQLIPREAKGVDAALVLGDIVGGRDERRDADGMLLDQLLDPVKKIVRRAPRREAYVGVPENLIVAGEEHLFVDRLRGLVAVPAEAVVVDRARIFLSSTFFDACRLFKISIQLCRPRRPTDKPQIERVFRRIGRFLQNLPGYIGPNTQERGQNVEEEELLTVAQLELALNRWVHKCYRNEPIRRLTLPHIQRNLSPREMYEELSAIWGTMRLPSRAADRIRMFPTWWVKTIHGYGVEFDGARYAPPIDRESDFLRELRGKRSQHNLRPELRGRWPIQRHPSDITRAYFEDPDTGEFEMLHMTHLPEGLVMSDAIWQRVKRRFSQLGGNPRDTVGRQQAAADIIRELEADPAWTRLAAQTAIEYEQQHRDAGDDEPSGDGEAVPPREAFQFDRDLVKRVDAAIKITSLAEIRGGSRDHELDEVETAG